ncbi:Pyridoxal-dependent decarboxylase [Ectocarpus siliculosus]|uniref:sphinganine-1-phosphate aldolase n=1 Tax=Ectocarpus siliculosus TaxID=2880 RepID=D7FSQ5_ECTSI|nr:Pyridoxal-dependent decarboxylase [Ectocarpus siliculosus]|eukprot:CBJ31196.1 Pyridoxal-dependent decarboxylase [Ectocarpus siliculosus]
MSTSDKRRSGMSFAAVSSICNIERRTWLSGRGLAAMAAGFVGTWWFLFCAHKAVGRTRGPWIHPRISRPIHRFRGAFVWGSLFTILLMRVVLVAVAVRALRQVWEILASPLAAKQAFVADHGFAVVRNLPAVARLLQKEVAKTEAHLQATLRPGKDDEETLRSLPAEGKQREEVIAEMKLLARRERAKWDAGKASGAVYSNDEEHSSTVTEAYRLFSRSNPLHPDLWPSGLKFEAEVISMTARLLDGGDAGVCGVLTSGGTESIVLAAKAHRDFYRERGVTSPEIVAATTAHAAIDKACSLMKIRLIKVPVDPVTMKADVKATANAMSANTIMVYASAPSFPHGVIDPVEELARLATRYGCGLHVDCCLGGFVLPFAKSLGYSVEPFDFGVEGVTSISADTHKYGYAPKGTSVALFRNKELRHQAYFCFPEWTGGLYVTPTIAGSRPGGLSAACWASMVGMGRDGYEKAVTGIMETVKEVAQGVSDISGLSLLGEPRAMVVCFRGDGGVNIYKVGDRMSHRGWSLNALQHPPCLHLCVTMCHVGKAGVFLADLLASTLEAAAAAGEGDENSTAAIYGMASSMPAGPVNVLLRTYTDVTLGS